MDIARIGQALTEGAALIASPSILNVLPLILLASLAGGRKAPFGIIVGFVLSFTLFALFSQALVTALHIALYYVRAAASILLLLLGILLLADWQPKREGPGIFTGAMIGPLWMPYAGPAMAAALAQAARGEVGTTGPVIAAFTLGAAIPMLAIALAGKAITNRPGFFAGHGAGLRKTCGMAMIFCVVLTALSIDAQTMAKGVIEARAEEKQTLAHPYPAPEFAGIEAWLNSQPLTLKALRGKVVLVDFWDYACANCINTLPNVTTWDTKYRGKGLVIIGVSSPEAPWEKNPDKVKAAMKRFGIRYPVALDNDLATWNLFHNKFWPALYLINKDGNVVYSHYGEGNYGITENTIRTLLGLAE